MKQKDTDMALEGFMVLNLAQDRGLYVGKLLADMGANVIKVEGPQGDTSRRIGPFKDDTSDPENSLYFLNFNTNQRGITLNLHSSAGQAIFKQLVRRADVVVEDFQPGIMESLGLGYPVLRGINHGIVVTSVTGFGPNGPYSHYKAPDIVSFAMSGLMFIAGDPCQPPVVAPCEQAYHSASVLACFSTLVALYQRTHTGIGQLVEVSAQEALTVQEHLIVRYSLESDIVKRRGSQHNSAPSRIYRCQDGFAYLFVQTIGHWKSLLELMGNPEILMDAIWEDVRFRRLNVDVIDPVVTDFTTKHTKMELTEKCQSKHIPCTPVNTPEEFIKDPHTQAREFVTEIEHPVIGKYRYLESPYKLSETPCQIRRSAPLLGQHNEEIYCQEIGYSKEELMRLKTEGVI
ncbi:CaiB/BaiF CoA transferase family protein [Chloroflexota bacterium]